MNENQQPTNVDQSAESDISSTDSTTPHVLKDPVASHSRLAFLSNPKVSVIGLAAAVVLAGLGLYGHSLIVHNANTKAHDKELKQAAVNSSPEKHATSVQDAATLSQQEAKTPPSSTPPKITPKPSTPAVTPAPAPGSTAKPAPAPAANTTNCLPPNPSPYATYYTSMTSSQYLQTNSYVNTTKLYAGLQFAGLLGTINSKQYVVLAMDDSAWNNFTQAQLNWMNASAANMRSVLGWQIITSCITWNGVNPVKDLAIGSTQNVTTLNGAVTYTHNTGGLGAFGSGKVGIWDWFTSNGSVTIAGFVNTSSIP